MPVNFARLESRHTFALAFSISLALSLYSFQSTALGQQPEVKISPSCGPKSGFNIDIKAVTGQLEDEGIQKFIEAYNKLLINLSKKRAEILGRDCSYCQEKKFRI